MFYILKYGVIKIMTLQFITELVNKKMAENEEYIRISFFELKIKQNLAENDIQTFLNYSKIRLENMNYSVYLTGEPYTYKGEDKVVESNDLMIAIKQVIKKDVEKC